MDDIRFELLSRDHDRTSFTCGKSTLDVFIRSLALQHAKKGVSKTFVAVRGGSKSVLAYYTIATSSIEYQELPKSLSRKLPYHPVPTVLIARLAVDVSMQGKGLGREIIADAIRRSLAVSDLVGVYCIHVTAKDAAAANFYTKFDFIPLPDQPRHLLLLMDTVRHADKAD